MNQADQDRKVEEFFRSYPQLKSKLALIKNAKTEEASKLRVAFNNKLRLIELSLDMLTSDERTFVEFRYFYDVPMREITNHMPAWSDRELYRLRRSILAKTAWIIGMDGRDVNVRIVRSGTTYKR